MQGFNIIFVVIYVVSVLKSVDCSDSDEKFTQMDVEKFLCPNTNAANWQQKAQSKIKCAEQCASSSACQSFSWIDELKMCRGFDFHIHTSQLLVVSTVQCVFYRKLKPQITSSCQRRCNYQRQTTFGTVLLQRCAGDVDFNRSYVEYEDGFGHIIDFGEFWIGNKWLAEHIGTNKTNYLKAEMEDYNGVTAWARYHSFSVNLASEGYKLQLFGYNGTAGDGLSFSSNFRFTTYDSDNDGVAAGNFAQLLGGGWWHGFAFRSTPTSVYSFTPTSASGKGIFWTPFRRLNESLKCLRLIAQPKY